MKLENENIQYIENYISAVGNRLPYKSHLKDQVMSDFREDILEAYKLEEKWVSPSNIFGYSDDAAKNIAKSVDWNVESAGWWRRLFAFIIDNILLLLTYVVLFIVTFNGFEAIFGKGNESESGENDLSFIDAAILITLIILFLTFIMTIAVLYWIVSEKLYGKTPGKKLLGLIVVDYDGIKMSWEQSIVRNITKIVGEFLFFDFLLGVVMDEDPDKSQRAMDVLAKTQVFKLK